MANPRHRHTRTRRDKRRANWKAAASNPNLTTCTKCGEPRLTHKVCTSCGTYKNRTVLQIVEKED